ncbi:MAG TPA: GAF domain-containing sensor histidine kinase [Anaerolineales bacterium]|nr:GAF domain-containing sensor histidine kinase [Anaerolineales bacterium]
MAEQLARLIEVSITLNSTLKQDELLLFIIGTAAEILDCESVSILLYDEKRDRLIFAAATGSDPKRLAETPVPLENSLAGTIFRENKIICLSDVQKDARHYLQVSKHINLEVKNLLGVPMRIQDKPTGVLEAVNKRDGDFDESDADILAVIASQAAVAIHNARLLEALQNAYDDLRAADQLKTNFLALASHELRTPLGVIIGYATFLQQESPGELSEHAKQVLNAAMQMRALVDAMTNMDMLRSSEMILHRLVLPAQQVLLSAYNEVKNLAAAKYQQITLDFKETPLPVKCDPEKLKSAFVNLLDNAIRFTPEHGKITLGALPQAGGDVLCWVEDNGIGIPQSELKKIFNEFYQIEPHTTRKHGGMGIGLSIAKGLIEAHGGKIWAESPGLNKGATFKVLLPFINTTKLEAPKV